jgi:transposase-like protein
VTKIRKSHSKQMQFKVAMIVKGEKAMQQVSQAYGVHQSILHRCKKTFLEEGLRSFEDGRKQCHNPDQTSALDREIVQITMDIAFLKSLGGEKHRTTWFLGTSLEETSSHSF